MDLTKYYPDIVAKYPAYVTKRELCEICHICPKTAYNLEQQGEIPYTIEQNHLIRSHKIKLTDILAYLYRRECRQEADSPYICAMRTFYDEHLSPYSDLLSVKDIQQITGFSSSAIVRWISTGILKAFQPGKQYTVPKDFKDMCRNLNGSWLNAGGGKNGRSNLLQIRPAPRDDDDETDKLYTDEGNGMSDMALHMKTLEIEFSLYLPSLTDMQKAILKQTIIELYNQFGIFWETDIRQLKATDFPILSDLHALLEKKAEANKENPVYRDLAMLLYDAAAGSDSFLWNGHTTLEANSRFICLDTHDLQNASDNVKRTQYLNLLSWCWEEMSRDRNERCLLVCDEAYLMIDPQVPQSLVFLRNVEKRARKYEAGLAIISHSVVDFLAPEVKMYGQALLDIPCYKILMGCDGKNLQETKDLYNLTDAEQELLESKRRGHALFIIGSKRLHVNFEIPAYKFSYMGKAGGR